MAEITLSYSQSSQGWTSFWSFVPDWMIGMNNTFFTWKNGSLYEHDTNSVRNRFYESNYDSKIVTVFNQDPFEVKMFKTLMLESNEAWSADITTDLNNGMIDRSYFLDKEGSWFAHIRRDVSDMDLKAVSTQGIGAVLSYANPVITFGFNIGTSLSQWDKIYKVDAVNLTLEYVGQVASHDATTITLVSEISAPSPGDVIVYIKDSVAESTGARGYYMQVELTNPSQDQVEIFEVATNSFKSFP